MLVVTSVWVDHLRTGSPALAALLGRSRVLMHPWVLGELALGGAARNREVAILLRTLPQAPVASELELLDLIEAHSLHGGGIGYVDAQLLASTALAAGSTLWSTDKGLRAAATELGVAHVG